MPNGKRCPECDAATMDVNPDTTQTCPKCHATYIPSTCKGIFVQAVSSAYIN